MRPLAVLLAAAAVGSAASQAAAASPKAVRDVAATSVVAVRAGDVTATGFAFRGRDRLIVVSGEDRVVVTAADGRSAEADVRDRARGAALGELAEDIGLAAVAIDRRPRPAGRAWAIGPPLGYTGRKIRPVSLHGAPARRGGSAGSQRGRLPADFAGAPVVGPGGRLVGVVTRVRDRSWTLVRARALGRLDARAGGEDDGGLPLFVILGAALAALVAILGSIALVSRRRRAAAIARADEGPPVPPGVEDAPTVPQPAGPLVRRRGPEPEPDRASDDFEVVVRSRGES
jgi:hypothetical protein